MQSISVVGNLTTLYELEGWVSDASVDDYLRQEAVRPRGDKAEITQVFRTPSIVSIGVPIAYPLDDLMAEYEQKVSPDIRLQLQEHDFYRVELACSLHPADRSRFHEVTFEIRLFDPDTSEADLRQAAPLAYDLWPRTVEDQITVTRSYSIKPDLELEFGGVKNSVSLLDLQSRSEYMVYQPRIQCYGLRESVAGWNFYRTREHEIGRGHHLFLILRKRRGTHVGIRFGVTARTEALISLGPIGPFPLGLMSRRSDATPVPLPDLTALLV